MSLGRLLKQMAGCRWSLRVLIIVMPLLVLGLYMLTQPFPFAFMTTAFSSRRMYEESFDFGRFGVVRLYRTLASPRAVVLFVSAQEGWDPTATVLARQLVGQGAIVAGVNLQQYQHALAYTDEWCTYLGGDFEALSKYMQKKVDLPQYELPVLVGYGTGASLVYVTLAQSPPNLFRGALSINFCPKLSLGKPPCQWYELHWQASGTQNEYPLIPASSLPAPWVVLQETKTANCDTAIVEAFVRRVPQATLHVPPPQQFPYFRVAAELSSLNHAFAQLLQRTEVEETPSGELRQVLPIVEVPTVGRTGRTLAVIWSGDGGWAGIDRDLSETLVQEGLDVLGVNSLRYFWTTRTPESTAHDFALTLRQYLMTWKKEKVILIGYSLGAEVLPFIAARLPQDLLAKVELIVLLAPSSQAAFEFHLTDWVTDSDPPNALPVLPEVEKLRGKRLLCFYGEEEAESLCPHLNAATAQVIRLPGGHHFDGGYDRLARTILHEARVERSD
jgi:type IV secretory pathway VirJ component